MKEKIIISPSNKKAIEFLKSVKDKKSQIQKHFAQPGSSLSSLKIKFNPNTARDDIFSKDVISAPGINLRR